MEEFQKKIDDGNKEGKKESSKARSSKDGDNMMRADSISRRIAVKRFPDVSGYYSECYTEIVNQYGFWKGIGKPLSKEHQRHLDCYYRLLRPKGAPAYAPFTHMQAVDAFGNLSTSHSYGPLLANPFKGDNGIDDSWESKLEEICQAEKISRNGVVVQENYYDAEGELILQYFPTSVSKNQIFGHYTDPYGALAQLRDDTDSKYVMITLDENGYESQIAFANEKGQLLRNDDDAFIQLRKYSKEGFLLEGMSADAAGIPMIDNWGNSGWRSTFDADGNQLTNTTIDQYGQPMEMPHKRSDNDVVNTRYTYDQWGNRLSRSFYDENWQPDTTFEGIHRYVYTFDEHGQRTSCRAEGLHGQMVNFSKDMAMWINRFDSKGNLQFSLHINKDSLLSTDGTCIMRRAYDQNGKQTDAVRYKSSNGRDSVMTYRFVSRNGCDTTWNYSRKYINVALYDSLNRLVSDAYYDLDMNPEPYHSTYQRVTHQYTDRPKYYKHVIKVLDKQGQPADMKHEDYWRKYNIEVTEVDSLRRYEVITRYDGSRLLEKYGFEYKEDFETTCGLLYYDSIGCRGRTLKADALYYKAIPTKSVQGNNIMWQGVNEFGEHSYILNGDRDNSYVYCYNVMTDEHYLDENGDTIPKSADLRREFNSELPKSFCIELTHPVALKYGLQTGDIIVRYGDWMYPEVSTNGRYYENMLCYETIRKATVKKDVVVMRHDPVSKTSKLIELQLPEGTPSQLGFIYHMLYLTKKEAKRYNDVMAAQQKHLHLEITEIKNDEKAQLDFIVPYKVGKSYEKNRVFMDGFKENAVELGWQPYVGGKTYFFASYDNKMDVENVFRNVSRQPYDSICLHYTVDGKTTQRYIFRDDDFRYYVRRSNTKVDEASAIYALTDSLQQEFASRYPRTPISLTPEEAWKQLLNLPGSEEKTAEDIIKSYKGDDKFGDVQNIKYVLVDFDSLSYDQMFLARDILAGIDWSNRVYLTNDSEWGYAKLYKGDFTEVSWTNNKALVSLYGNLDLPRKEIIVINAGSGEGHFQSLGLNGKYVLLNCNEWHFGMDGAVFRKSLRQAKNGIRKMRFAELIDEGGELKLGRIYKKTFPEGVLGISYEWLSVPDNLFYDAMKLTKQVKKREKDPKKDPEQYLDERLITHLSPHTSDI